MAAGSARSAAAKHAYRMFAPSRGAAARCPGSPGADEFDESDVWGSKILGVEYRDHQAAAEWELHGDGDDDYEYGKVAGVGGAGVPPAGLAWRGRAASLSVHEGIGRTLKGRDLSRVRDAVWKKTGFED
uniref:Senescence regulator n=1 Tax=Oryza brachyantha TaxID=4533 RepID=J3LZM8_ORYBR